MTEPRKNTAAPRFSEPLTATVSTFGTPVKYAMEVLNFSESGLLLRETQNPTPFNVSTLLEISIEIHDGLETPIHFVGKIIRTAAAVEDAEKSSDFGTVIVEISDNSLKRWSEYLLRLESTQQRSVPAVS